MAANAPAALAAYHHRDVATYALVRVGPTHGHDLHVASPGTYNHLRVGLPARHSTAFTKQKTLTSDGSDVEKTR
jgi:hypothetical protein